MLALTVAAFGGMVRDAVTNGEVAASWQVVGADATVTPSPAAAIFTIPAATARAIAGVPGVTHAARVYQAIWVSASGTQVIGVAVDPADYAALVAATEGYPAVAAGLLAAPSGPGAPGAAGTRVTVSRRRTRDGRGHAQHAGCGAPGQRPGGRDAVEHARAAGHARAARHARTAERARIACQ